MEIQYPEGKQPEEIINDIETQLGGRKLGKILDFKISGSGLEVVIKKMGTSTLTFEQDSNKSGTSWTLTKEKIALTHRPMKSDMLGKITAIIEKTGGKIIA